MTFLTTDRLTLRNVAEKDAEIMHDYRNNEICTRYQRGQTSEYDKIVALVERRKNDIISVDNPFMLTAARKETDEMVGEIVVIPKDGTIMMGYTVHYAQHRKGYAFEALSALIDTLHERYPAWQFICFTEEENIPSQNLLKKLGYVEMGYDESEHALKFGKWIETELIGDHYGKT